MIKQTNALIALGIITFIGFIFVVSGLNMIYSHYGEVVTRIIQLEERVIQNELRINKVDSKIDSLNLDLIGKIKYINDIVYGKEIKLAKKLLLKSNLYGNYILISYASVSDSIVDVTFHFGECDGCVARAKVNIDNGSIVEIE